MVCPGIGFEAVFENGANRIYTPPMGPVAKIIFALVVVGFVAFIIFSALGLDRFTCRVCLSYQGRTDCASASGTTEMEARRTATDVVCANLTSGVTNTIACTNTQPQSVQCREN